MYPAFLWADSPGHDEYPRVSVLITASASMDRFFRQASGTWFDRSVIFFSLRKPGMELVVVEWESGKRDSVFQAGGCQRLFHF